MRATPTRLLRRLAVSVRVRVTATALLAVGAALGVSATVLDAGLQHDKQRILMATAQEQARNVVDLNPDLSQPLELRGDENIQSGLVQVLRNGNVIGASRPLRSLPPLWEPGQPQIEPTSAALGDLARDVRVVAVPVVSGHVKGAVVVVTSLDQYDHSVAYLQNLLEIGTPMLLIVVGLICWLIVGRALRPIELMRREVAEVASSTVGHRVAEPASDDEVGRLARTLNSMLDRIQAASERERRFVSDASHELRSPIANIRTELEVALHHPGTAAWEQIGREVLGQNERMERLVAGLLLLARSDEGSLPAAAEPVDLGGAARQICGSAGEGPVVELHAGDAWVRVPQVYVERMVANLVDNARRFAESRVSVTVASEDGFAELRVADDGPGVPEADRQRIFERFVRLDEARDRGEGGFGLGLAIVADLSRFYGGSIEAVAGRSGIGAEFVLRLPLAGPGRDRLAPEPGRPRPAGVAP